MFITMKIRANVLLFVLMLSSGIVFTKTIFGEGEVKNTAKAPQAEQQGITDKNIVAIVNGQKVAKQELYNLLVDTYGEDALDVLIRRTLIRQAAEKEGLSVTSSEISQRLKILINSEIDALMRRYRIKDRADLEKELTKINSSIAEFEGKLSKKMRKQAEIEVLAEKVMTKTITITEEELRKVYEQEYGEKIEASQIVFKSRSDAEDALKKIKSGADFATIAKSESIDRVSAAKGGKMQPFSPKDGIGSQVAHLKAGEISDIIKTDYGYHIIKINGKKPASNKDFNAVRSEIEKVARNQRYKERLGPWLISLIENASITKNLVSD